MGAGDSSSPWSRSDTARAGLWFLIALLARAPLVARVEGALDHDQSVVGLMALDIAAGRRLPIFFDGQRYMGAVEAYVAAGFVRLFGHSPSVVALAPLLAFGIFAAAQYVVWRLWRDRATGDLAALITVTGAPMFAIWSIIPRGGYVEFLAWALPTLAVYRALTDPSRPPLSPARQAGWGFLLAVGYFLNPFALTVYATLALDWLFVRHGAELRAERLPRARWLDSRAAAAVWCLAALGFLGLLALLCHVDPASPGQPYIAFGDPAAGTLALALAAFGVVGVLGCAAWWSNAGPRLLESFRARPWTILGIVTALLPFVLHGVLVQMGMIAETASLPMWITAPWKSGMNLGRGLSVLGVLVGCAPRSLETVLLGQGVDVPAHRWGGLVQVLNRASPVAVGVVALVAGLAVARERDHWRRAFALRCDRSAPPVAFLGSYLCLAIVLFLLQGTSPDSSAVRYLIPVWVALPGLLACGFRAIRRPLATILATLLLAFWALSHASLWADMGRQAPARPLMDELARRGVRAIVAPTPVALIVANLSHGAIGAREFRPFWSRLGRRYASRFPARGPFTCVVDRGFPWAASGERGWAPEQDFGKHLRDLSAKYPGTVVPAGAVGPFTIWEVRLPLDLVLNAPQAEPAPPRSLALGGQSP